MAKLCFLLISGSKKSMSKIKLLELEEYLHVNQMENSI